MFTLTFKKKQQINKNIYVNMMKISQTIAYTNAANVCKMFSMLINLSNIKEYLRLFI